MTMPIFGLLLLFLGLFFILIPLLLFSNNLVSHFKEHRKGLPHW
jgi:hypothetical protein